MTTAAQKGRPPKVHDNRRVRAFLSEFRCVTRLVEEASPLFDDILAGAVRAATDGAAHQRPMSKAKVFRILWGCEEITSDAAACVLSVGYKAVTGRSTVARYTAAARVASWGFERLLDANPSWDSADDWAGLRPA